MHIRSPIRNRHPGKEIINKITFLIIICGLITAILIIRLFNLQVINYAYYQDIATREQYGYTELPAQRGEIIITDYHSDEEFLLATNTTLNLLYVDPTLIKDPVYVADLLAPLIFDIEYERAADNERILEMGRTLAPDLSEEEINILLKPLTDEELETQFRQNLITKISEKQRKDILLSQDLDAENLQNIKSLNQPGIEIIDNDVYAHPSQIGNTASVSEVLAPYVGIPTTKLTKILKGENRYVVLQRKLDPDISAQISEMVKNDENELLTGIGMKEEYFRYYPEGSLAANVIGYVNRENIGLYGIESTFNTQLQGLAGQFQTKRDSVGRQITVGESVLTPAVDGDDIILTIDRSVQMKVDQILEKGVKAYGADSGQVIIMNPQNGEIIAMSHYPTFDPNNYGDVFEKEEVNFTPEEMTKLLPSKDPGIYYFYYNAVTLDRYLVFEEKDSNGNSRYYRYVNLFGPEVYHNKIVSWPYEPGSVFKSIVMAIAIDDGDVTPNTTYDDSGPVGVDFNPYTGEYDYEIKNATGYYGLVNMQTVLGKSLNTGMTFVAKKIGPPLFYSYLKKFGFLDRTDIEFDTEVVGTVEYYEDWTESELATKAFGQGLTVTLIQLANAYAVLANGGILMEPHIIKEIRHDDGTSTITEPRQVRRVISEETSSKITAMLVNAVENGVAQRAQIEGHFVAGKTGTAQTYKWGQALSGAGTTIATFTGFAPIDDPQFVVVVKFDRPKSSEWADATAAPTFTEIGEFLFDYYNIPPDKK